MLELTEVGTDAMTRELLRLASNGERDWSEEDREVREQLRSYVDLMIEKAHDAQAERAAVTTREVRRVTTPTREEPTDAEGNAEDHEAGRQPLPPAEPAADQGQPEQEAAATEALTRWERGPFCTCGVVPRSPSHGNPPRLASQS